MDMDESKMEKLKADLAHLTEEEKENIRKEKEKEIEDLLNFEKRFLLL